MAATTGIDTSPQEHLQHRKSSEATQVEENEKKSEEKDDKKNKKPLEFAHSFPVHTKAYASILSKESTEGLSFRGFGNLACAPHILTLVTVVLVMIFGNLRLMVENYVKVTFN
jgi:hypothetical protein